MRRLAEAAAACLWAAAAAGAAPAPSVDVAAADNAFGFRLLNAVQVSVPQTNVVLSPIGAALDLSVLLNGAEGETREQMLAALSLGGSTLEAVDGANAELIKLLAKPANDVTLSVAESLWIDSRRATLRPGYVAATRSWSDAAVTALDFAGPGAAARMNRWAAENTHGRIEKVIERIEPADLVLLLNAVYFKGKWTHPFDKRQTQARDFTLVGGAIKQLPRMTQTARFEYFETPALQAVRLSFGAADVVMDVLLPAQNSSLRELEAQLTPQHWTDWTTRYATRPGTLELPRFELASRYQLNKSLQALGMSRLFALPGAQIAGMFSPAPGQSPARYYVGSVLQSTYWTVDEEGAEAAAATSIGIRTAATARPPEPFRMIVDRPFFCAIEDRRSGALLFVGAIYDPAG